MTDVTRSGGRFGAVTLSMAWRSVLGAILMIVCVCSPAHAQTLTTVRVASGLARPLFVTAPRGDYGRLFIVEQWSGTTGRIRVLNLPTNTLNAAPFLSVSPVATGNEEGLLGLAFHPNFLQNGYFWIYYTNSAGNNTIVRYQANAPYATSTTANAASATPLLTISHPGQTNHNGGWMAFGPDGYLYIGTGDGGSSNDPPGNAQNINVLLGKMLRLDVDGTDNIPGNDDDDGVIGSTLVPYASPSSNPFAGATPGSDEVYFIGLRNPWRNSFDRETGAMYIGDVGQGAVEEVDYIAPGTPATPVVNLGWRCMEGNSCTGLTGCTCNAASLTMPIQTYTHSGGACSITGGYAYRGCVIPDLDGTYFYADYCSNQIFSFVYSGSGLAPAPTNRTAELAPGGGLSITGVTSFGEDADGEMYIVKQGGDVFKIIPRNRTIPDCNSNGIDDALEVCRGVSLATSINGQPASSSVCPTGSSTFTVSATGSGTLTYRWQRETSPGSGVYADLFDGSTAGWDGAGPGSGAIVSNSGTSSMTIAADTAGGKRLTSVHAIRYRCAVSTPCAGATSNGASLLLCAADMSCDGFVDDSDFVTFSAAYDVLVCDDPSMDPPCVADLNGGGLVDDADFVLFAAAYDQFECP